MEKDYRLFVKNLPTDINESKIEELFGQYVTVKKIDLKERKDLDDKINKFAFINVTTTDKKLNSCFVKLNGERIDGFEISVELAKESFLDRLKRERSENKVNKQVSNIPTDKELKNSELNIFNNVHSKEKPKHQVFHEFDISNDFQDKSKRRKQFIDKDGENINSCAREFSDHKNFEQNDLKNLIDSDKDKKNILINKKHSNGLEINDFKANNKSANKQFNESINLNNDRLIHKKISEKIEISESEKKRLNSLKQKKQVFKAQEQTIRNALKSVDSNALNNKIIFDDNINFQTLHNNTETGINKKNVLFDSDDEDQDKFEWNEDELNAKANLKNKLLKLQTNIGNDKRFVLDERFMDDEHNEDEKKQTEEENQNKVDEKKWQLDILENVLGKSVVTSNNKKILEKKNKMIRYDPLANNHQDFEIVVEKNKEKPVKKKKKSNITEVKEEVPIPISKEVFYDVSEKLIESLKQNEGFSILKTFGQCTTNNDDDKNNSTNEATENKEGFQFNFSAKNPFKYDSSDDECDTKTTVENDLSKPNTEEITGSYHKNCTLFFAHNDLRFQEAKSFFKIQSVCEEETFKNRRRELKEIIRSKIRNNMKKTIPWNRKRVRKIQKNK